MNPPPPHSGGKFCGRAVLGSIYWLFLFLSSGGMVKHQACPSWNCRREKYTIKNDDYSKAHCVIWEMAHKLVSELQCRQSARAQHVPNCCTAGRSRCSYVGGLITPNLSLFWSLSFVSLKSLKRGLISLKMGLISLNRGLISLKRGSVSLVSFYP